MEGSSSSLSHLDVRRVPGYIDDGTLDPMVDGARHHDGAGEAGVHGGRRGGGLSG